MPDWAPKHDTDEGVVTESKKKVEKPRMYKVLLHNDDFTSMEFVVLILQTVFNKAPEVAHTIMMAVHQQGIGVAGVYTFEVAEAKVLKVTQMARAQEFPLLVTLEEE
jgi:ATP-dependent Clp protease adaptor protein ClpS